MMKSVNRCRECKELKPETEPSDYDFTCMECYLDLKNNADSSSLHDVVNLISDSDEIEDKSEAGVWCGFSFESEKTDYLIYGHTSDTYPEFLVQTYISTKESMPETIWNELLTGKHQ